MLGVQAETESTVEKIKYDLMDLYWMNMYVRVVALKIHSTSHCHVGAINPHFLSKRKHKNKKKIKTKML